MRLPNNTLDVCVLLGLNLDMSKSSADLIRDLQTDNRVLKKYVQDLRQEVQEAKAKYERKEKALNYAKQLLMAAGVRDHAFEKIRQIELNVSSLSQSIAKQEASS